MTHAEYEAVRHLAIRWTIEAGAIARDRLGLAVASRKADQSVVTDADLAVQELLLERIGATFSDDAAITEESQSRPCRHASTASAKRCWVIDPIDGTRNYARGFPLFSVAVALLDQGRPVVGVVHNPISGQMFSAVSGGGAWCDGRRLAVRDQPASPDTVIAVPSARRGPLPRFLHEWMDRMVLRNVGSTALHLAMVACGAADAAYSDDCRLWDMAAGALIASEAGATVVRPDGGALFPIDPAGYREEDLPFLAAAPALARELLADCAASTRS
ncbi:MAG: inositol monophosphatase [Phycisphaerae bacterium]